MKSKLSQIFIFSAQKAAKLCAKAVKNKAVVHKKRRLYSILLLQNFTRHGKSLSCDQQKMTSSHCLHPVENSVHLSAFQSFLFLPG